MSIPASWLEVLSVAELVEPRAREQFLSEVARYAAPASPRPKLDGHIVLVGHRGAGKTRLLGTLARLLARQPIDLDALIAHKAGVSARAIFERSPSGFRRLERDAFTELEGAALIAAGGGFLFHHGDLLEGHTAVLVPLTLETFRERMRADTTRPRLRPELTFDEEIDSVFAQREPIHRAARTLPLAQLVAAVRPPLAALSPSVSSLMLRFNGPPALEDGPRTRPLCDRTLQAKPEEM